MGRSCRRRLLAALLTTGTVTVLAWVQGDTRVASRAITGRSDAPPRSVTAHQGRTFTTNFPRSERPLREGNTWHHQGRFWAVVTSGSHHAFGSQTGTRRYDDSYAYLSGFSPDQAAQATLWINVGLHGDYREFELLLRWADTLVSARGYECNLSWNGSYAQIVRWNGPFANFTYLAAQTHFAPGIMPPRSGDIFTATIKGSTISVYLNKNDGHGDRLILRATDATYKDGNPGMGFYIEGPRDLTDFGFARFVAWSD